ncbi:hypothetical protein B0T11DRAFT_296862 [Plectosphaerella cucumerina]|uniref:BZIP domain-containing protein n=1 Tax=Plectosphaerella cucumerina TaxID=40658 RepID=A0A8K0TTK2_9PEZI|nr:hypothetical protein B0T11DRAFT_296862 [Plectosphaerella cucumerina]
MSSNSNHEDETGEPVETSAVRAEKKRYSDRVAQQRHRQRRKDYISDLEAQLRLFKDGGESQMAQIVSENTRLRKELERTNSMLGGIRELLGTKGEPGASTAAGSDVPGVSGSESARPSALAAVEEGAASGSNEVEGLLGSGGDVATAKPSAGIFGLGPFSDLLPAQQASESFGVSSAPLQATSAYGTTTGGPGSILSSQSHGFSTPEPDLDQASNWWLDPSLDAQKSQYHDGPGQRPQEATSMPWSLGAGSLPSQRSAAPSSAPGPGENTGPSSQQYQQQRQGARSPTSSGTLCNLVQLFGQADPRQWDTMFTSMSSVHFTRHHYAIPPRVPLPPPGHDVEMHGMLHIARTHMNELGPPTLRDFVAKDTPNPLSREIKVFADPMLKANMTAEYFAAYWILYLLFRWQAVLDEPTYRELPSWLRPTKLQLEIEHHFLFDQIPWPDLRDELIKLSLTNMPEAFSCVEDIGRYLRVNMHTTYEWSESNLPLLRRDLSNLGRWKLAPDFFRNHPQFVWTSAR